jgi:hypothetical protein
MVRPGKISADPAPAIELQRETDVVGRDRSPNVDEPAPLRTDEGPAGLPLRGRIAMQS